MKQFFLIFSLILVANTLFGQIKVIDKVSKKISVLNENSIYEVRIDEIEEERIKISFRSDTANSLNEYGYIYLKNIHDLEELRRIIINGLEQKKDQNIHVDLGDSQLILTYSKSLFGGTSVRFTHSYLNNPYQRKMSKYLSRGDIEKLFLISER